MIGKSLGLIEKKQNREGLRQMELRNFKKEDAPIIAGWIQTEEELYKWSADSFNKFPLTGDDIIENYMPRIENGRFYPLTAIDVNGDVIGHLNAARIELAVFENNESARRCYEAAGFTAYAESEYKMPIGTWNCTDMELHIGGTR